jgi:AcrR family transcriptional regulator
MTRWPDGTADRLHTAALALFAQHGVDATTVEQISTAAGVTARTFHRLFADKEEVLFFRDAEMELLLVDTLGRRLDVGDDPFSASLTALKALFTTFEGEREALTLRQQLLRRNPRLLGRQLVKQAGWQTAMSACLEDHGVPRRAAVLTVARAAAITQLAFDEWIDGTARSLTRLVDRVANLDRSIS